MAHPKHQSVRIRYAFCCGYCGISETDAGGELTVDHFHPTAAGGDDSDENLVYACFRCNMNKGFVLPLAANRPPTLRLLHPLRDNLAEHLQENRATGRLEGLTPTGTFHINTLQLNRAALIANRLRRRAGAALLAELDQSRAEIAERRDFEQALLAQVRALQERLKSLERTSGEPSSENAEDAE